MEKVHDAYLRGICESIERYNESVACGSNRERLLHARQLGLYLSFINNQIDSLHSAVVEFRATIEDSGVSLSWNADTARSFQQRLASVGLYPEERYEMRQAGLNDTEIDSVVSEIVGEDLTGFESGSLIDRLQLYENSLTQTASSETLYAEVQALVEILDTVVTKPLPTAEAGGPYYGVERQAIAICGSGTSPDQPLSYSWDLDGDGFFGDLTDSSGEVTFPYEGTYQISLLVIDASGWGAIDIATVKVANTNDPPRVRRAWPSKTQNVLWPSNSIELGVEAEDPDGDHLTYSWFLESDSLSEAESTLTINLASLDPGLYWYKVKIRDGWPGHVIEWHWYLLLSGLLSTPGDLPNVSIPPDSSAIWTLTLSNVTNVPMKYFIWDEDSLGEQVPWLWVEPESGVVEVDTSQVVILHYNTVGMDSGLYKGYLKVQADDYYHTTVTMLTTLTVGNDVIPPAVTTTLTATSSVDGSVTLCWTAPGDDDTVGTATMYDIRYSTVEVGIDTSTWWEAADTVANEPPPSPAGEEDSCVVTGLTAGQTYYFAIKAADEVPNWSGISNIVGPVVVGIEGRDFVDLPKAFALSPNYPNPFNSITEIRYALPKDCWVKLEVYNILGQRIMTLVDGEQNAGYKTVRWDAGSLPSGIYFIRLKAGDFKMARRMVLLK